MRSEIGLRGKSNMAASADASYGTLLRKQMLAGGLAGMLADGVVYPMMTVKSRLMVQGGASSSGTAALYMYKGPLDAMFQIGTKEGLRTLYKGFSTVTQIAPTQAMYMATYQTSKRYLPGGPDNPLTQFGGGVLATLVQSSLMVPVEVIRQRQMIQTGGEGAYTGSVHAVKAIVAQEGIGALYRGFLLAQLVWGPYNAVYLPLWEANKRLCVRLSGAESVEKLGIQYELGSAFVSSAFAAGLTNPMDVIKTRLQVQGKNKQYSGAWDAAKKIYAHEGVKGLTSGITSRMLWVAPSATIMFTTYDQIMKRLNE